MPIGDGTFVSCTDACWILEEGRTLLETMKRGIRSDFLASFLEYLVYICLWADVEGESASCLVDNHDMCGHGRF